MRQHMSKILKFTQFSLRDLLVAAAPTLLLIAAIGAIHSPAAGLALCGIAAVGKEIVDLALDKIRKLA